MILVWYVALQDNLIKGSGNFMTRNQSRQVTILPGLLAIGTLTVEIYAFSLPGDLDTMASPPPVWLVSFELNTVDVPAC